MDGISIFDIFKIGIGPSSSHTLGPWNAARDFISDLDVAELDAVLVQLYGSLSKTGKGHATDKAVILGLMNYDPETIDVSEVENIILSVQENHQIPIKSKPIDFDIEKDILYEETPPSLHPNTLKITAYSKHEVIKEEWYMSVGGGFIETPNQDHKMAQGHSFCHPIKNGSELLSYTHEHSCAISQIVMRNELMIRSEDEVNALIDKIKDSMLDSIFRGCSTGGILPGGLNVVRRAKKMNDSLLGDHSFSDKVEWMEAIKSAPRNFSVINKWVINFALAVNEENAAMGRVVTSPTNGAAGVIPAVLMYYLLFCDHKGDHDARNFLFTAGEIGCLFKKGATISAAVGGCQAEIGVSSAMAAAGLTEVLGGSPEQCLMAAEIAIEHHFGLTCDPVNGLVQIPCIERNAMGAMKAITAAHLAVESDPSHSKVSLDAAIKTMWDVAQDMNHKYKETAEGGLAINLPVINPNC